MRKKITALAMLAILVLMAVLVWSPPAQSQSPTIDYTVTMEDAEVKLDVRPGQSGTASTKIIIRNSSIHSLTIELQSNCGGSISVTPISATVGVQAGGTAEQPLSISALPKTALQQKTCSVNARVIQVDGLSSPDPQPRNTGFLATIWQFAQVAVEADQPFMRIGPGKQMVLTYKIRNSGNYQDDYQITIPNAEKLEEAGFSITLATPILQNVPSGDYTTLKVSIQTPRGTIVGWSDDYFSMEVQAASIIQGERSDTKSASTTFWVRGVFLPGFDPLFTITALGLVAVAFAQRRNRST